MTVNNEPIFCSAEVNKVLVPGKKYVAENGAMVTILKETMSKEEGGPVFLASITEKDAEPITMLYDRYGNCFSHIETSYSCMTKTYFNWKIAREV